MGYSQLRSLPTKYIIKGVSSLLHQALLSQTRPGRISPNDNKLVFQNSERTLSRQSVQ